ncbi:c-type cytochrome [Nitrospira sp. Nam74]
MKDAMPISAPAALILTVAAAAALMTSVTWAAPKETAAPGFAWTDGAEIYAKVCALCHETSVAPAIRGLGHDPLYIRLIVRHGSRAMPAFRVAEIDDESLEKLAEYVSKAGADK